MRGSAPRGVLVDPRVCKCIHVFKIRRMSGVQRGRSRGGRNASRVGREGTRGSEGAARQESHDGEGTLVSLEGMIVKTGLQDAAKNVRIYGTISAASSSSARPLHRRRASRIALPCPFSLPLRPLRPRRLLTPARIFFSMSPSRRRFAERASVLTSSRSSLRVSGYLPLFRPSMSSSSSPLDHPTSSVVERGAPPPSGAHSGARLPPPPRAPL